MTTMQFERCEVDFGKFKFTSTNIGKHFFDNYDIYKSLQVMNVETDEVFDNPFLQKIIQFRVITEEYFLVQDDVGAFLYKVGESLPTATISVF